MAYILTISHVDTCLPDYVTDHCNGDDETLVGIMLGNDPVTLDNLRAELLDEIDGDEKLPEDITSDMIREAIAEEITGRGDAVFWEGLAAETGEDDEDDSGDLPYAWFHVSWETE